LYLYAWWFNDVFGHYPKMYFNFISHGIIKEIKFDKIRLKETLQWALDVHKQICAIEENDGLYYANIDQFFCTHVCSMSDSCKAFNSPQIKMIREFIEKE